MKLLYCLVLMSIVISCKSPENVDNTSKLTKVKLLGPDYRKCVCCGGIKLSFDVNSNVDTDTFYLVNQYPENNIITDSTKFPILVNIDWKFNEEECKGIMKKVDILKIEK